MVNLGRIQSCLILNIDSRIDSRVVGICCRCAIKIILLCLLGKYDDESNSKSDNNHTYKPNHHLLLHDVTVIVFFAQNRLFARISNYES